MSTSGRPPIDYTRKDYASLREAMLELARERLPEWTDQSPNDLGVLLVELFASMGDALFYYQDRIANESYLDTAREPRSIIQLLRLIGYELRPPLPSSANLTLLFDKDGTGEVPIPQYAEFRTTKEGTGTPVSFRYLGAAQLTVNLNALTPSLYEGQLYKVYSSVPVTQVDARVEWERVASSDGSAGQRYRLARPGLIDSTLTVRVQEATTSQIWQRRDTLLESSGTDNHYTVRRDEVNVVWLEFGDGRYGRKPPRGHTNITADYMVGGGLRGNVPTHSISKSVSDIPFLKRIVHAQPASGGLDRESLEEGARRGPRLFRSMGRAVTGSDYEAHARSLGVAKARAVAVGPRVDLYVAPAGGGQPSDVLKDDLLLYFEERRVVTSLLQVLGPTYIGVELKGTLTVENSYSRAQVSQRVSEAVRALWSFDNVNFGETLYLSKVYEAAESIEGVAGVSVDRFARADGSSDLPQDGRLVFSGSELPVSLGFSQLTVMGGRTDV